MKTIKEWFMEFPEEIRERALNNLEKTEEDTAALSNHSALYIGFKWLNSPEGTNFWSAWFDWFTSPSQTKPDILPDDHEPELIPDAREKRKELRLQIALAALPGVAAKDVHSSSVAIRAFQIADEMIKLHERGY
jgi:hypothetical protein